MHDLGTPSVVLQDTADAIVQVLIDHDEFNFVITLRHDGLRSIFDGDTTVEEVLKYT